MSDFDRTLRLLPYFKCANSEGSGKTVRMRKLAWAFTDRLCDKAKKIYECVSQVSRPYQGFCPDPKHFIVNCGENVVKFAGKWGKMYWKIQFYIKCFEKIKCYAGRPYLVFSKLKPETHIFFFFFFFFGLSTILSWAGAFGLSISFKAIVYCHM